MRRPASRLVLALWAVLAAAACTGDDAVGTPDAEPRALTITGSPLSMLAGDSAALGVIATDAAGRPLAPSGVSWSSSDTAIARVSATGVVRAIGHGPVRIRAAVGSLQADADVAVRLSTAERRLAYAFAHEETPAAPYQPMGAFAFNATGGGIRIARIGAGRYRATFERLARHDSTLRDVVLVTAYGSGGERCHIEEWGNASNGRDLDATVACFLGHSAPVDSRFTILVVGARALPGRHGFAVLPVSTGAGAGAAATLLNSYSSSGQPVAVNRSAPGSYLVHLNAPRTSFPENYFISTVGDATDLCKVSSWNQGEWASVVCYAPSGAHVDARFSLLMLEEGRPGKRFGFAWANDPTAPIDQPYAPPASYQRSSAGVSARVTRLGVGEYAVDFPGLANVGATAEIVQVSPFGAGLTTCQLEGWTEDVGATLRVRVRCWNRASNQREDGQFTVLVLE